MNNSQTNKKTTDLSWLEKAKRSAKTSLFALAMGVFALVATACTTASPGFVETPKIPNDIVVSEELRGLLKINPKPAIALRMKLPETQRKTRAAWQQNTRRGDYFSRSAGAFSISSKTEMTGEGKILEIMERELVRAGFTIRDRVLLEKLLTGKEFVDYSQVGNLLNIDIIIEITNLDYGIPFHVTAYRDTDNKIVKIYDKRNGRKGRKRGEDFLTPYNQFKGKVIIVKSGAVGGTLEINHCTGGGEIEVSSGDSLRFRHKNEKRWRNSLSWLPPYLNESAIYTAGEIVKVLRSQN
jgi:hypothetical protein